MPIYFGDIPPYCPVSRDQPAGPLSQTIINRHTIPHAFDYDSALAAANAARLILQQLIAGRTINNVFTPPPPPAPRTVDARRQSRWVEQKDMRVKGLYKYYGSDPQTGEQIDSVWVMTERIEQMVWYDRNWRTFLTWNYGDKGEGESLPKKDPVDPNDALFPQPFIPEPIIPQPVFPQP